MKVSVQVHTPAALTKGTDSSLSIEGRVDFSDGLVVLERKISCLRRESNQVSSGF